MFDVFGSFWDHFGAKMLKLKMSRASIKQSCASHLSSCWSTEFHVQIRYRTDSTQWALESWQPYAKHCIKFWRTLLLKTFKTNKIVIFSSNLACAAHVLWTRWSLLGWLQILANPFVRMVLWLKGAWQIAHRACFVNALRRCHTLVFANGMNSPEASLEMACFSSLLSPAHQSLETLSKRSNMKNNAGITRTTNMRHAKNMR